jgi:hypothetical protein
MNIAILIALLSSTPVGLQQDPGLPSGPYTLLAGNRGSANFIVVDSIQPVDQGARLISYRVYADPIRTPDGAIVQETTELVIDCQARTWRMLEVRGYDADGAVIGRMAGEPARAIEPRQTWDFVARYVCDGLRFPASQTVEGPAAARVLAATAMSRN